MVTYAFLKDPDLLNRPYREIAAATNVAVGTVGWVVNALKAGKYIYEDGKIKKRRIINYQKLLDRWTAAWPEKLKPNLLLGKYLSRMVHRKSQARGDNYLHAKRTAYEIYT